jgi:hypothetical protein
MTVAELIEQLKQLNADMEVVVNGWGSEDGFPTMAVNAEVVEISEFVTHHGRITGTNATSLCYAENLNSSSDFPIKKAVLIY